MRPCQTATTALLLIVSLSGAVSAQQPIDITFDAWLSGRIRKVLQAAAHDGEKQVESPSVATASTSLVDRSGAPDLVGLALRLARLGGRPDTDKPASSTTVSAYALRSAVTQDNPLDPAIYQRYRAWRQWSFTLGQELDAGSGTAPRQSAQIVAVKFLAMNRRDLSHERSQALLRGLGGAVGEAGRQYAELFDAVQRFLFLRLESKLSFTATAARDREREFVTRHLAPDRLQATLALVGRDDDRALDELVADRVAAFVALGRRIDGVVERIRRAPQLAVTYQTRLRDGAATDEHRWEGIFDYGLVDRINLSLNASFDLEDRKGESDVRGGTLAGEFQVRLAPGGSDAAALPRLIRAGNAMTVSFASAAEWRSGKPSTYKAQAKLAVPVPGLKGVTMPVSLSIANRTELIKEKEIRGLVGFTVDFSQLTQALAR